MKLDYDRLFDNPNETWDNMKDLLRATQELLQHDRKFIFAGGPPGISKTTLSNELVTEYNGRFKAIWDQAEDDDKTPRRPYYDNLGSPVFRPPIKALPSHTTALSLYLELIHHSNYDEGLILDDPTLITNPDIQSLIMMATDKTTGYTVGWQRSTSVKGKGPDGEMREYPSKITYNGSITIITNFTHDRFLKEFAPGFQSRPYKIFFPTDRDDIANYIDTMAFKAGGLFKYVLRVKRHKGGAGFTGTIEEALPILRDVQAFFRAQVDRLSQIDFRFLEEVTKLRTWYPDDWKSAALRQVR
jgi:hypothetical protein